MGEAHLHSAECYARNDHGFIYVPCRKDGRDRNRLNWNIADFRAALRTSEGARPVLGAILVCSQ